MLDHRLARLGQFAVAAAFGRHVDDYRTGLHRLHHLGGNQPWGGSAGNQGRGDDDVDVLGLLGVHFALGLLEALAHHLGIAAAARTFFLIIDGNELGPHRLDLIGDFRTGVVGPHDGAQAHRGADGGKAGDASAGDEHLGGRNLARRSDLAVEVAAEDVGRLDHRAIAADARH